jgi:hypothetical protein
LIFSRLDARTLSTARNAKHVEMQHAQSRSKEKRCGNRRQIQINT